MKHKIDLESWNRKEHYNFFKNFSDPIFGIVANVECKKAYELCKKNNFSFFLYYTHKSLLVANSILEMRYRIEDDEVVEFDVVHASPTIDRPNGTFGFAYFDFHERFEDFAREANKEIEKVRNQTSLIPTGKGDNVIYYTTIPWVSFTSISHPRSGGVASSIPTISFGKYFWQNEKLLMPVELHAHHALMDGRHIGEFFQLFEKLLNE